MQQKIQIQVSPTIAYNEQLLKEEVKQFLGLNDQTLFVKPVRRSIDARNRNIKVNLTIDVFVDEPPREKKISFDYKDISKRTNTCHIIGAGPAGLFAALRCLELN